MSVRGTFVFHIALVLLMGAAATLPGLWQEKRTDGREVRHAEIAREMVERGEYLVPHLLGRPYTDKTPLFNWVVAGLYRLTGQVNIGLARLPSALSAIAAGVAIYLLGRRWLAPRAGLLSSLMWFTFPLVSLWGRRARMDMLLTALVLSAIVFATSAAARKPRHTWAAWLASGILISLATLAKGPIALFFFTVALPVVWRAEAGRWLPPARFLLALLAILLLSLTAWIIPCEIRHPGHLKAMLTYQFGEGLEEHEKRAILYIDALLVWTFPWALFAAGAAAVMLRRIRQVGIDGVSVPAIVFVACLAAMILVPNKRPHYLLPIVPLWALWLGMYLHEVAASTARTWQFHRALTLPLYIYFSLLLYLAIALLACMAGLGAVPWAKLSSCSPIRLIAPVLLVAMLAGGGLVATWRGSRRIALWFLLTTTLLVTAVGYPTLATCFWEQEPEIASANAAAWSIPRGCPLGEYGADSELLHFKLNRPVVHLTGGDDLCSFLTQPGPWCLLVPSREVVPVREMSPRTLRELGTWRVGRRCEITALFAEP